ncbi:discoidin domain-containing protein [Streptomyces sp. NPDC048362]|uniref:discoidin domain-containing protein n=1 Tax=Streptomyces sp. NPDC048362 TaxID=3365539 RepID=UPI00371EBDEA
MIPDAPTLPHDGWTARLGTSNSLTIDIHHAAVVSGLVYRPRQGRSDSALFSKYVIWLSADGKSWGKPVAGGTVADDATTKTLRFSASQTRYVRLVASTKAGTRAREISPSELDLLGDPGVPTSGVDLPRDGWTATASSEETHLRDGRAGNALDGDPNTMWHTVRTGDAALPQSITIDMHRSALVSSLTYEPRLDHSAEGRIGQYSISTSLNGTSFGEAVATGTWEDDDSVKSATFKQPVNARYVRLTASTEAGGRGPWSSAAEVRLRGPSDPAKHGQWSPVIGFPLVPAATALLPNNKLLAWSAYAGDRFVGGNGYTQTALMDLTTSEITQRRVENTRHDMFCPGTALLADGRILVTGGNNAERSSIYDPATDQWTSTSDMNIARGYQAMTLLANGDAFVIGGSWAGDNTTTKDGEVWSATTGIWRKLSGVPVAPIMTADPAGPFRADNHAWLYATSGGHILQLGPSKQLNWISTDGNGSIAPAGTRADSADAMNGDAVAYDVGKLLTLGGAPAYEDVAATNRAYTVTVTDSNSKPTSTRTGDMSYARAFANSVVMPDGEVAVFGGQSYAKPFSDGHSVLTPEIWDPTTGHFTPMASMSIPRNYHSVANLLPDGRIFTGGGGLCGDCATNHADGAIFTPPNLLNVDGTEKPRPHFTSRIPSAVTYGQHLEITSDMPIKMFTLIRTGSVTHSVNNDQRRIPVTTRKLEGNTFELDIPDDPGVALPGTYMLFAVNEQGTPGQAAILDINAADSASAKLGAQP